MLWLGEHDSCLLSFIVAWRYLSIRWLAPLDFLAKQPYKYYGKITDWRVGLFSRKDAGQIRNARKISPGMAASGAMRERG
jgi:hypothetical protein